MGQVRAARDIKNARGYLVAKKGRSGVAKLVHKSNSRTYGKVAVLWEGTQKVAWMNLRDLKFRDRGIDPSAYVSMSTSGILPFPSAPGETPQDLHFGRLLRAVRKSVKVDGRSMTQSMLARSMAHQGLDVSQTTVSLWERQSDAPNGRFVRALAKALQVPIFGLFVDVNNCEAVSMARHFSEQAQLRCEAMI